MVLSSASTFEKVRVSHNNDRWGPSSLRWRETGATADDRVSLRHNGIPLSAEDEAKLDILLGIYESTAGFVDGDGNAVEIDDGFNDIDLITRHWYNPFSHAERTSFYASEGW